MTWTKPQILLLDEPSNHLDIDACNALIEGLAVFKGGVLMVWRAPHWSFGIEFLTLAVGRARHDVLHCAQLMHGAWGAWQRTAHFDTGR